MLVGDKLVSSIGEDLLIENYNIEVVEELVQVYNFQVEDFHTYHVGENCVWVHNAQDYNDYEYEKYAEYLDDDYISKERVGRCNGKTPRNNQVQNKQVKRVVAKYKLDKAEQRELHKMISHDGGGFWDVDLAAQEIVNNRK